MVECVFWFVFYIYFRSQVLTNGYGYGSLAMNEFLDVCVGFVFMFKLRMGASEKLEKLLESC